MFILTLVNVICFCELVIVARFSFSSSFYFFLNIIFFAFCSYVSTWWSGWFGRSTINKHSKIFSKIHIQFGSLFCFLLPVGPKKIILCRFSFESILCNLRSLFLSYENDTIIKFLLADYKKNKKEKLHNLYFSYEDQSFFVLLIPTYPFFSFLFLLFPLIFLHFI